VFTSKGRRPRGRPKGRTEKGLEARRRLYQTATRLFAEKGYEQTTLRDIASAAGVSPCLLYKYFPSKAAVVLELYDELSAEFERRARSMRPGPWRERALFALETSLDVLGPHRSTLAALASILIADPERGVFSGLTQFSRARVEKVFIDAVVGAREKLMPQDGEALGRLLYLLHLAVILWWLLDKSPSQSATRGLIIVIRRLAPAASLALRVPRTRATVLQLDELVRRALY
jgi:AcrR family transcriptional regulator